MIDTYFDRTDWPTWMNPKHQPKHWDDPRYFNGSLYSTVIDCNVAEAKAFAALVRADERDRLAAAIDAMPFGDTAASFAVWIRNWGKM